MDANKGSLIAKGGFRNEDNVISKLNAWRTDVDAQNWLISAGYDPALIETVQAIKGSEAGRNLRVLGPQKTDVQINVKIITLNSETHTENIQVKLVSNKRGLNQIDKRWISKYVQLWNIPENIETILKRFTGEIAPTILNPRDERRVHKNENRTWRDRVAKANSYQRYQRAKDIIRYAGEDVD